MVNQHPLLATRAGSTIEQEADRATCSLLVIKIRLLNVSKLENTGLQVFS